MAVLCGAVAAAAPAAAKFTAKLPDGYQHPHVEPPEARHPAWWGVDIVLLVVALSAASYLALKRRSRRGLFWVMVASVAYFGFFREGCVCPIGAIQNVTSALADSRYVLPGVVAVFFALPLIFTLLFGRTFCAAVCPLGGLQDMVGLWPISVPRWITEVFGLLAWAYLAVAVLFAATGCSYIICEYDPFIALFRLGGPVKMIVLGACVLVIGLFIARPYCRFLCPYGALLRVASVLSWRHTTITPDACIECRLCEESCPYDAIDASNAAGHAPPRTEGKRRLAVLVAALPVMIAAGAYLGTFLSGPFSRMHHEVRLAERVRAEAAGHVTGTTDASDAFYKFSRSVAELYDRVEGIRGEFTIGCALVGAFMALVIALKLIALSVRRTRTEYTPHRATCFSCGRCFDSCPIERVRRKTGRTPEVTT